MASPCRGCGGSGIGAHVSPREAQIASQTVYLTKRWPSEFNGVKSQGQVRCHARIDAWEGVGGVHKGRLAFSGPLGHVIDHLEKRIEDGYEIDDGYAMPDRALACEWCNGYGTPEGHLTLHAMQEAIEEVPLGAPEIMHVQEPTTQEDVCPARTQRR